MTSTEVNETPVETPKKKPGIWHYFCCKGKYEDTAMIRTFCGKVPNPNDSVKIDPPPELVTCVVCVDLLLGSRECPMGYDCPSPQRPPK
jgi:hypothetical protein